MPHLTDARATHRIAFRQLWRGVSLSAESARRIVSPMTKRKRNSLIDLGLAFLVVLACIGTATVTLAGKI